MKDHRIRYRAKWYDKAGNIFFTDHDECALKARNRVLETLRIVSKSKPDFDWRPSYVLWQIVDNTGKVIFEGDPNAPIQP